MWLWNFKLGEHSWMAIECDEFEKKNDTDLKRYLAEFWRGAWFEDCYLVWSGGNIKILGDMEFVDFQVESYWNLVFFHS